jgi:hypothetical protein
LSEKSENALKKEPQEQKRAKGGSAVPEVPALPQGYVGKTPPQGQLPAKGERTWVDRPDALLRAVSQLQTARLVAVDAEFTQIRPRAQQAVGQEHSPVPRLALLQLAIERQCFIIDALRLADLTPLMRVFGKPDTDVLLHGAGGDVRVMAERGLTVTRYYDLEATSRSIFGQHESSLAAMLQRAFGMRLDKSLQRTDWTRRPLPQAMIAYAARDAEVTLALYGWLKQYYPDILALHYHDGKPEQVAAWIEPFLYSSYTNMATTPEAALVEAKAGSAEKDQMYEDCRAALQTVVHPLHRSRLLRLIADLSLAKLIPELEASLCAPTADERAAAVRALARLDGKSAHVAIGPLLGDPVQDVRRAVQTALRNMSENTPPRTPRAPTTRASDGARSWVIETPEADAASSDPLDANDWKARLRAMMEE